jgi:hypothetical protein
MIAVVGSLVMSSFACALFWVTVSLGRPPQQAPAATSARAAGASPSSASPPSAH